MCSRVRVCLENTFMSRAINWRMRSLVALLHASTRKETGPALHRPSSFNQGVPGSSPGRLTNHSDSFRRDKDVDILLVPHFGSRFGTRRVERVNPAAPDANPSALSKHAPSLLAGDLAG